MHNRFSLERMNGEQALDVILKPGAHLVDEVVAREIVRFVSDDDDEETGFKSLQIEPALLSLVCRELNARRLNNGEPKIFSEEVKRSQDDILKDFYERSFDGLEELVRIFVEDRLVTVSGFRSTVALEDAIVSGLAAHELAHLVDRRLLRKEDRLGIPHLELTHDVLTSVVQKSRDARRERARIEKERREREAEDARRRNQLRRTQLLMLTIGSVALVFLYMMQKAEHQARLSFSHQLLTSAKLKSTTREHGTSLLLRAAAYHNYKLSKINEEVESAYYEAVTSAPYLWGTFHHEGEVVGVTWDEKNDRVWSASASSEMDWAVEIWNWNPEHPEELGKRTHVLQGHTGKVEEVVWNPERTRLASAGWDGNVMIWDAVEGGNPLRVLEHNDRDGHLTIVRSLAWNNEGTHLATASEDFGVRIWDAESGALLFTFTGHTSIATTVDWSKESDRLVSADHNGKIRIWNAVEDGEAISILDQGNIPINAVAWMGLGNRIASASDDGKVRIWDLSNNTVQLAKVLEGHLDEVWRLSWKEMDGVGRLASADKVGEIRIWNDDELERVLIGHEGPITMLKWNTALTRLASVSSDRTLRIWDPSRRGEPVEVVLNDQLEDLQWPVQSLSLTGERVRFTSAEAGGKLRMWQVENGDADSHLTQVGISDDVALASANKQWSFLASTSTGDDAHGIQIWSVESGELLRTLEGHTGPVTAIEWNRSGNQLASVSRDGTVCIWNPEDDGSLLHKLVHDQVKAVAWNGKDTKLASLGADGKIRIWNANKGGEAIHTVEVAVETPSLSLAWNPKNHQLAAVIQEGKIHIWEANKGGKPLHILRLLEERTVGPILWNNQGNLLASGCGSGLIRIWDTESERISDPHFILKGHEKRIMHLAWNETGTRLASVSLENRGKMRLWKLDDESWRQSAKRIVNRNLTEEEWRTYIGIEHQYPVVFPELSASRQ
ncbi:MAG: WD40 repeat domain-containing protein [Verrucomicrobiales bacterium]